MPNGRSAEKETKEVEALFETKDRGFLRDCHTGSRRSGVGGSDYFAESTDKIVSPKGPFTCLRMIAMFQIPSFAWSHKHRQ
jgi:hypothetical protein